ncbi:MULTISPECIES: outer membrane protein [unclassified Ruegeria]|uniref:outer membrane protein n=1 Tax=unclassified Ruegeria TaxID=2625375 RepID=UPI0020C5828A|nr:MULTISPECIES: porin family protein [unclassified Ruegeria]
MRSLRKPTGIALGLSLATLASAPVSAQQSDWSYEASVYLFMPETDVSLDTRLGTVDGSLSFSDALENLDFAFMGAFSATNGRWLVLADYSYTDLSFSNDTPGPATSGLDTSFTTQYLSGYIGYRAYDAPGVQIDAVGGFRWFSTDTVFQLQPGTAPGRRATADDSWTDPIVGARARVQFSDKWSGTGFFDYGGFRSGSETWQVLLTADYAINERWLIRGGYRYISFDHEISGNDFTFEQSGPLLGVTYRF